MFWPLCLVLPSCYVQFQNSTPLISRVLPRHHSLPFSSMVLMCFLMNSNDEKKMALTTQDRPIDTPRPRYIWRLKNSILGAGSTFSPLEYRRELRWYILFAESMGSKEYELQIQGVERHSTYRSSPMIPTHTCLRLQPRQACYYYYDHPSTCCLFASHSHTP